MGDIYKAVNIGGWMKEAELEWLATQAEKHFCIVELGVFIGRSARALGDNTPGRVFVLDKWHDYEALPDEMPDGEELPSMEDWEQIRLFRLNMSGILYSKVIPIMCDHRDLRSMTGCSVRPDMVFIDGDHHYESVKDDINFWQYKTIPGGLICGHDFSDSWPGVKQAVLEIFPDVNVLPGYSIWWKTL